LSNNNPIFLEQWTNGGIFKENGEPQFNLEKAYSAYSISARQLMDKNKQLTLVIQCNLAFTGKNVLSSLKIRRDIENLQARRDAYFGLDTVYPFMPLEAQPRT
jgi:hypothetical protein